MATSREFRIARAIDLSHATRSEGRENLVRTEARSDYERHGLGIDILSLAAGTPPTPLLLGAFAPRNGSRLSAPRRSVISYEPNRVPTLSVIAPIRSLSLMILRY